MHEQNEPDHLVLHEIEKTFQNGQYDPVERFSSLVQIVRMLMQFYDAFDSIDEMKKFAKSQRSLNYHYFDFDWTTSADDPQYWKNMFLVVMSQQWSPISRNDNFDSTNKEIKSLILLIRQTVATMEQLHPNNRITNIFRDRNPKNQKFIDTLIRQNFLCFAVKRRVQLALPNATRSVVASISHPTMQVLKPACDSNMFISIHIHDDKKIMWTVVQPVKAGEQLFYSLTEGQKKEMCALGQLDACENCEKDGIDFEKIANDSTAILENYYYSHTYTQSSYQHANQSFIQRRDLQFHQR